MRLSDYLEGQDYLETKSSTWKSAARIFYELRKKGITVRSPIGGDEVAELEFRAIEVLVATGKEGRQRPHDLRPPPVGLPPEEPKTVWLQEMKQKLEQPENRALYRLRQQTVEPVFGIVKEVLGFRRFLLRGVDKVHLEWQLVTLAYNCKRLHRLTLA